MLAYLASATFIAAALSGCASLLAGGAAATQAPTVSAGTTSVNVSPSMFDYIGPSTRLLFLSPEALVADNPRLEAYIIEAQCQFHTPDPPLAVPNEQAKNWTFAGRLLRSDRYMEALEYRRIFLPGMSGPEQTNTWPVKLETLSHLPDEYLSDQLAFLTDAKLSPAQRTELDRMTALSIKNARKISAVTQRLERSYNPQRECGQEEANAE